MDAAGRVVEGTLRLLARTARAGMRTDELDALAAEYIQSCGAEASFLGYAGYPKSICTSVNSQVVHGIPGRYRLRDGDILSVDVGAKLDGFHGDAARTILIGEVPEEVKRLVEVTRECFFKGLEAAVAGNRVADIARAVQRHAESHGYGVVRELIGHGIGRDMHEPPDVPNYWDDHAFGHGARLQAGMTIAIEPMINLGTPEVYRLADGWTVATADGRPSAHYENTVAITDGAPRLLTLHEEA
ncbi:MAG: type I methionyl aminopeptidase [Clostridia bacterium]|nr:type I methionyl aminopeptidase [Clostridia bacterium]